MPESAPAHRLCFPGNMLPVCATFAQCQHVVLRILSISPVLCMMSDIVLPLQGTAKTTKNDVWQHCRNLEEELFHSSLLSHQRQEQRQVLDAARAHLGEGKQKSAALDQELQDGQQLIQQMRAVLAINQAIISLRELWATLEKCEELRKRIQQLQQERVQIHTSMQAAKQVAERR